jgi:hypothetical protein
MWKTLGRDCNEKALIYQRWGANTEGNMADLIGYLIGLAGLLSIGATAVVLRLRGRQNLSTGRIDGPVNQGNNIYFIGNDALERFRIDLLPGNEE